MPKATVDRRRRGGGSCAFHIPDTATAVAAGRAIGAKEPDPLARNPDFLAARLLGDPEVLQPRWPTVRALSLSYDEAMLNPDVVSSVRMMTVRTRYIDEALAKAVARGAQQIVILGSGLDTYAYRHTALLAPTRVFEVDRSDVQQRKRLCVLAAGIQVPDNLRYVSVDFERDALDTKLRENGLDVALPTLFVMEGVSMYIDSGSLSRTLSVVAQFGKGSSIVFDFLGRPKRSFRHLLLKAWPFGANSDKSKSARRIYKPERYSFPLDCIGKFFMQHGLRLDPPLPVLGEIAASRYLTRGDGSRVGDRRQADVAGDLAHVVWRRDQRALGVGRYHISEAFVL